MRFEAIKNQRETYPVHWMCGLLDVTRSAFYEWARRSSMTTRKVRENLLVLHIKAAHDASRGIYGSPRVHQQLVRDGVCVSRKTVERLMREHGLAGRTSRKFVKTTVSDSSAAPAENLLNRDFTALAPNQKWVTDITYLPTDEGFVYLAAINDLFSNKVVGWSMANHMRTELVLDALSKAILDRRPEHGLLHHSDRGSQYTSQAYQKALSDAGIICSMSRRDECWDNACAESFFGRLKEEILHGRRWKTRQEAIAAVRAYIEGFYNSQRIQKRLGYMSPLSYELVWENKSLAA